MTMFAKRKCGECGKWVEAGHDCSVGAPENAFELWGYNCAIRGETTCPFAKVEGAAYARWHRGYDLAERAGLAMLPRFRDVAGR